MIGKRSGIPPHVFWPGMVIGLLCMSLTTATVTVIAAVGDPSFAVEEDYYERALHWDEHVAQQQRNAALGWGAQVNVGAGIGEPVLSVRLLDAAGKPVEGAAVSATYFHFADRASARTVEMTETDASGSYVGAAGFDRPGLWRVSLVVTAHGETFTSEQTIEIERR